MGDKISGVGGATQGAIFTAYYTFPSQNRPTAAPQLAVIICSVEPLLCPAGDQARSPIMQNTRAHFR